MKTILLERLSIEEFQTLVKEIIQVELNQVSKDSISPNSFLTRKEAATYLRISLPTLNSWTQQGFIKGYKIKSRVRYRLKDVEKALSEIPLKKFKRDDL